MLSKIKFKIITILIAALPITGSAQFFVNPLFVPSTISGTNILLSVQNGTMSFYPGYVTNSIGFNGNYLGPTLLLNKGDSVSIHVQNNLSDTTTVHWHGMHVSPQNDGGPHVVIPPATSWNPSFKIRDVASMHWYHSHLHMHTAEQVTKGEAGLIIVKDPVENALSLPRTYGIDDVPLVVQSRAFDGNKQFDVMSALDSVVLINGTKSPFVQLPAQIVRIRLLNGSSMRIYNFGLSNNSTFYQIASDGGLLNTPLASTRLMLAPGERAEILLDLNGLQGQTVFLNNFGNELPNGIYGAANPAAMGFGTITNYSANGLNGSSTALLRINVVAQTTNAVTGIPSNLVSLSPFNPALSNITRNLTFSPKTMGGNSGLNGPYVINGSSFNMMTINYTIPLNNTEIWSLTNNTPIAHPFHLHGVHFFVLDINGSSPPAYLAGRKDVILVRSQQTVRFITQFTDFSDPVFPYMYHCHMLMHEDDGMMGQFLVTSTLTGISETTHSENGVVVYPNPSHTLVHVQLRDESESIKQFSIEDLNGKLLFTNTFDKYQGPAREVEIDLRQYFESGVYFLKIETETNKSLYSKILFSKD